MLRLKSGVNWFTDQFLMGFFRHTKTLHVRHAVKYQVIHVDIKMKLKNPLAVLGILLINTRFHMLTAVIFSIGFKNNRACLIQIS